MITPQKAVESAVKYLVEIIGELEQPTHFTVEKLSISPDKTLWTVVLGYEPKSNDASSLSVLLGNNPRRYKIIEIDAISGDGISLNTFNPSKG